MVKPLTIPIISQTVIPSRLDSNPADTFPRLWWKQLQPSPIYILYHILPRKLDDHYRYRDFTVNERLVIRVWDLPGDHIADHFVSNGILLLERIRI